MNTLSAYFYLDVANEAVGPLDIIRLCALHSEGTINSDTLVCIEGAESWQTYGTAFPDSTPDETGHGQAKSVGLFPVGGAKNPVALRRTLPPDSDNTIHLSVSTQNMRTLIILLFLVIAGLGYFVWSSSSRQPLAVPLQPAAISTPKAVPLQPAATNTPEQKSTTQTKNVSVPDGQISTGQSKTKIGLPDVWIAMWVEIRSVTSENVLICYFGSTIAVCQNEGWREIMPQSRSQAFIIVGHPRAGEFAEGDVVPSGVVAYDGVARDQHGKTFRRYRYISEVPAK